MAFSNAAASLKHGWRSGLEETNAALLKKAGVRYVYEKLTVTYVVDEVRKYTPDFVFLDNGIVVETKGRFVTADRKKLKLVKQQYPDLDLRIVFSNPNARISKTSKTSYAKWSQDHGFPYAKQTIPAAWLTESVNTKSLALISELMK